MHRLNRKLRNKKFVASLLAFLLVAIFFFASINLDSMVNLNATDVDTQSSETVVDEDDNSWLLRMSTRFDNYYISDTERNTPLYLKNENEVRNDPLAMNMLVLLLTMENYDSDDTITISSEIARLSQDENISNVLLIAGELYSVEYLSHAVILNDSKAALMALALNLDSDLNDLSNMMQARLRSLGMSSSDVIQLANDNLAINTTSKDLNLLLNAVYNNRIYRNIFRTRNTVYLDQSGTALYLRNRMTNAWSISNNRISGASLARNNEYVSIGYIIDTDDYSIFLVQSFANDPGADYNTFDNLLRQAIVETDEISQNIFNNFERNNLVSRGEEFNQVFVQENIPVNLVYLNTVYYLKPVRVDTVDFVLNLQLDQNISLPIRANEKIGQINFIMPNGEIYTASVGSDNDIFSENTSIETFFSTISANENIVNLIIIILGLVLIVIVLEIIKLIVRHIIIRRNANIRR